MPGVHEVQLEKRQLASMSPGETAWGPWGCPGCAETFMVLISDPSFSGPFPSQEVIPTVLSSLPLLRTRLSKCSSYGFICTYQFR